MAEQVYAKTADEFNQTERSGKRTAKAPESGLYRHPESGQEAFVQGDPLWGNAMAQGFTRLGFVFVRDLEEGDVKTLPEMAIDNRAASDADMKGLNARLAQLEADVEKKSELEKEVAQLRAELAQKDADAEAVKEAQAKKDEKAAEKQAETDKKGVADAGKSASTVAADESAKGAQKAAEEQTKVREGASGNTNTKVTEKDGK